MTSAQTLSALCVVCALCALPACATPKPSLATADAVAATQTPWSMSNRAPLLKESTYEAWPKQAPRPSPSTRSGIIELGYWFYSNHLTKVDGAQCEHRPTCSRYSIEAMRKHGFVVGSWLTIDRLLRSGRSSSLKSLELRMFPGGPYYVDPVEENDFFF